MSHFIALQVGRMGRHVTRLFIGCSDEASRMFRWLQDHGYDVLVVAQPHHNGRTFEEEVAAQELLNQYQTEVFLEAPAAVQ